MQAFEIKTKPPTTFEQNVHPLGAHKDRWVLSTGSRKRMLASRRLPTKLRKTLERAPAISISEDDWADAGRRLIMGTASQFTDPLPDDVRHEIQLLLHTRPELTLEYAGRGNVVRLLEPGEEASLMVMDIVQGKRRYYFRPVAPDEDDPTISARFRKILSDAKQWLDDPDARLVMSVGSGGYRMFAVTPILKALDALLDRRSRFAEIWGCSGGSVAAHVYSEGFDPWVLDEFGYQIYHRRNASLPDFSVASVSRLWLSKITGRMDKRRHTIQHEWVRALDQLQPAGERRHERIPFYAISSNRNTGRLFALTDPEYVSPQCDDFIVPTDRGMALAASCAVPLIFPTQRVVGGRSDGGWMDGGLIDENPLALPFVKWSRERERDPEGTPAKLKIFMFDLNARVAESTVLSHLSKLPVVGRYGLQRVVRTLDILLDSRSQLTLNIIAELPHVEVMRAKLSLGAFAVRDRESILPAIRRGRIVDSWELSTIKKGAGQGA